MTTQSYKTPNATPTGRRRQITTPGPRRGTHNHRELPPSHFLTSLSTPSDNSQQKPLMGRDGVMGAFAINPCPVDRVGQGCNSQQERPPGAKDCLGALRQGCQGLTGVSRGEVTKRGRWPGRDFFFSPNDPWHPWHPCPDLTSYSYYLLLYYMIL